MTATLDQLTRLNQGLRVFCDACQRCADLNVKQLNATYGPSMPLPEIGKRARCSKCGYRGGSVQVVAVKW